MKKSSEAARATRGGPIPASHQLSVSKSCRCVGLSRGAYYKAPVDWLERDGSVIDALNGLAEEFPRLGFWKYDGILALRGFPWNHKRLHRVYCALGLNQPRRTKKRLPERDPLPLVVPLVRVFEQMKEYRGLPAVLRVDNGPEFLGQEFVD